MNARGGLEAAAAIVALAGVAYGVSLVIAGPLVNPLEIAIAMASRAMLGFPVLVLACFVWLCLVGIRQQIRRAGAQAANPAVIVAIAFITGTVAGVPLGYVLDAGGCYSGVGWPPVASRDLSTLRDHLADDPKTSEFRVNAVRGHLADVTAASPNLSSRSYTSVGGIEEQVQRKWSDVYSASHRWAFTNGSVIVLIRNEEGRLVNTESEPQCAFP